MAEVACPSSKAAQLAHFPYLVPKRVFWLVGLDGASVDAFKNASDSLDLWMVGQFQNNLLHRCEIRSEEHTSELQSHSDLVCRLLLEKKNTHSIRLILT